MSDTPTPEPPKTDPDASPSPPPDSFEIALHHPSVPPLKMKPPGARRSVFIVEDEEDARELLADGLRLHGLHTVTASGGDEAWRKLLAGYMPSIIILDLRMPNLDGFQFLQELRAHRFFRDLPVIIHSSDETRKDYEIPWVLFHPKPAKVHELVDVVHRFAR